MTFHLAIVVADTHTPGARDADLSADREHGLRPLLDVLEATPSLRPALHLSQELLDHITHADAELMPRLQALAKKKRVNFLCSAVRGGIPWLGLERDGVGQLKAHRAYLERQFSAPVRGAWPVGLAWHPLWPRFLGRVGLRYTLCNLRTLVAGGAEPPVRSWVKVRSESNRCAVLPFDSDLMHQLPALSPEGVVRRLEAHAERGCRAQVLVLPLARLTAWGADTTGAYLRALLELLVQQSGWLRLVAPELLLERTASCGEVHPPTSMPLHMAVGGLAEGPGQRLLDTADSIVQGRDFVLSARVPGLTGPPLEAYLASWPEAGRLVDRATRVSAGLAVLRRRATREKALQGAVVKASKALQTGSTSGVLWDGDGGLVGEPAARWQAWVALTEAEDVLWASQGAQPKPEVEVPEDGGPVFLRNARFVAAVDPIGGAVVELSVRGLGNVLNTLTPMARPWSSRLADHTLPCLVSDPQLEAVATDPNAEEPPTDPEAPTDPDAPTNPGAAGPSLPDAASEPADSTEGAKVHESARGLAVHRRPFALFQDLLLPEHTSTGALALGMAAEEGDFAVGDWRVERAEADGADVEVLLVREGTVGRPPGRVGMVQITKRIRFSGTDATVSVRWTTVNRSRDTVRTRLGVVLPINLDGQTGPERTLHLPGVLPRSPDTIGAAEGVADFALRFADHNLLLRARPDGPVRVDHFPLVAPIRRRAGHVGVFQGTVAVLSRPLELWGEETRESSLVLEIHQR